MAQFLIAMGFQVIRTISVGEDSGGCLAKTADGQSQRRGVSAYNYYEHCSRAEKHVVIKSGEKLDAAQHDAICGGLDLPHWVGQPPIECIISMHPVIGSCIYFLPRPTRQCALTFVV